MVDPTTRAPPQGLSSTGETTTSLESSEEKTGQGKDDGESDGAQCLELTSPTSQTSTVDTPSSADNGYVSAVRLSVCVCLWFVGVCLCVSLCVCMSVCANVGLSACKCYLYYLSLCHCLSVKC